MSSSLGLVCSDASQPHDPFLNLLLGSFLQGQSEVLFLPWCMDLPADMIKKIQFCEFDEFERKHKRSG